MGKNARHHIADKYSVCLIDARIQHGGKYRFSGDLTQTIASYNAGPEAVERWTRARPGREWDEFVEEIPYKETNLYVKKVLRSYYIYSLMYPP